MDEYSNKIVLSPAFKRTLEEIKKKGIKIPARPDTEPITFNEPTFTETRVIQLEDDKPKKLDPKNGHKFLDNIINPDNSKSLYAFDESVNKFTALEGKLFLLSLALVKHAYQNYIPSCLLQINFYTFIPGYDNEDRSIKSIKPPDTPESESKKDYVELRNDFILKSVPNDSIIIIDGPLIGEMLSSYNLKLIKKLSERNSVPIFLVKNSAGSLAINSSPELANRYNSDLHWAHKTLNIGERSNLFRYVDNQNPDNTKVFCYIKAFKSSPERFEVHPEIYKKNPELVKNLMDMVYYLMLVQGTPLDPQARLIYVAERYAKAAIKLIKFTDITNAIGLTPTINQERFGWG